MGTHGCRSFHRLHTHTVFKNHQYNSKAHHFFISLLELDPLQIFLDQNPTILLIFLELGDKKKVSMESPQSVVSCVFPEPEKQNLDLFPKNPTYLTIKPESEPEPEPEQVLGVLDVHIYQARDIQNICIYHKQDVYAKICITCNPEKSVTTHTINGGGKNPVFNETLRINIPTIESSLKCEIYMLSRVRNYLEDQLLGFALIPLSEIIIKNGKFENEFTLSSTDLFHSPSGFVHLSLSYTGVSPDVISIPPPLPAAEAAENSELTEFDKIEFPDPKIANENHIMVSEYFGISSESLVSSSVLSSSDDNTDDHDHDNDQSDPPVETTGKPDSPVSTNGSECAFTHVISTGSGSSDETSRDSKCEKKAYEWPSKEKPVCKSDPIKKGVVSVNFEVEQKVVQQDFVDLYMKSMQQFTESLAKMKLPLDVEKERSTDSGNSGNSGSDEKIQTPDSKQSRVFYGSRAFF